MLIKGRLSSSTQRLLRHLIITVELNHEPNSTKQYDRRSPEQRLPCFRVMFVFWAALLQS